MERRRRYPARLVVITDGSRGVAVADPHGGEIRRFPVEPVERGRPNRCGRRVHRRAGQSPGERRLATPTDDDIRFAMAAGALATTRQGALTALPTLAKLGTAPGGRASVKGAIAYIRAGRTTGSIIVTDAKDCRSVEPGPPLRMPEVRDNCTGMWLTARVHMPTLNDPVAFSFGPFDVRWYAIFILLGIVAAIML